MKIKKILSALIIGSVIAGSALSASAIDVYVDNVKTALGNGTGQTVEPFIQDGTTYVPLRGVSEALGCKVEWDGDNRTVKVYQEMSPSGKTFRNWDDDIKVYIDDEEVELLDANGGVVRPFIINGTTFIPLRGISQALCYYVKWDGPTQSVNIYKDIIPDEGLSLDFEWPYKLFYGTAYYESEGEKLDINGTKYYNSLEFQKRTGTHVVFYFDPDYDGSGNPYAFFNLDSKYQNMTFIFGHTDKYDEEKEIEFIVDGKVVKSCTLKPYEDSYEVTVPLNMGLQLKIVPSAYVGMGNIVFHGSNTNHSSSASYSAPQSSSSSSDWSADNDYYDNGANED